jgi:3-methyladenine DNA glycosylase AlkD
MNITAQEFLNTLETYKSATVLKSYEGSFPVAKRGDDQFMGVRMGQIFTLAKEFQLMELNEIEKLLENKFHEVRVGAVSIMDYAARNKKYSSEHKKALFDLYIRRHDRINNWDLVDRSAIHVVGSYLFDKKRDILYTLAKSQSVWERRTAIVCTAYFIGKNDLEDTFKIAEILVHDENEFVQKGVGWMLRYAGDKNNQQLKQFLDTYASTMPRIMLRYAIEKFDKDSRKYYLNLK